MTANIDLSNNLLNREVDLDENIFRSFNLQLETSSTENIVIQPPPIVRQPAFMEINSLLINY
tara:strand:- start:3273 stop:3458 length:186 start_codon:yes stop_codon:yes gene_type:complete